MAIKFNPPPVDKPRDAYYDKSPEAVAGKDWTPPPEARYNTLTIKQFRNGMLLKDDTTVMPNAFWATPHRMLVEAAEGHDDRFLQTRRWITGSETVSDSISVHLFHVGDKVLIYVHPHDTSMARLWVWRDGHEYMVGELEETPKGLIIGQPLDDFAMMWPVEVPSSEVKKVQRDRITGELLDKP